MRIPTYGETGYDRNFELAVHGQTQAPIPAPIGTQVSVETQLPGQAQVPPQIQIPANTLVPSQAQVLNHARTPAQTHPTIQTKLLAPLPAFAHSQTHAHVYFQIQISAQVQLPVQNSSNNDINSAGTAHVQTPPFNAFLKRNSSELCDTQPTKRACLDEEQSSAKPQATEEPMFHVCAKSFLFHMHQTIDYPGTNDIADKNKTTTNTAEPSSRGSPVAGGVSDILTSSYASFTLRRPSYPPEVWSNYRGGICEALPYFRAYKGSLYTHAYEALGFLIDREADIRDVFSGQIVISSM